jgi:hypothetical protein
MPSRPTLLGQACGAEEVHLSDDEQRKYLLDSQGSGRSRILKRGGGSFWKNTPTPIIHLNSHTHFSLFTGMGKKGGS